MSVFRDTSLILECPKCETINYLDPFSFWNFKGKVKCAGCGSIWAYELVNGTRGTPGRRRGAARQAAWIRAEQGLEADHGGREGQLRAAGTGGLPGKADPHHQEQAREAGFRSPAQARGPGRQPPEEIRDVIL
jgi:hypothetical protein